MAHRKAAVPAQAPPPAHGDAQIPRPLTPEDRIENEQNTIDIFRVAAPATVFVTQSQIVRDRFSLRATEIPAGTGSGFILGR